MLQLIKADYALHQAYGYLPLIITSLQERARSDWLINVIYLPSGLHADVKHFVRLFAGNFFFAMFRVFTR